MLILAHSSGTVCCGKEGVAAGTEEDWSHCICPQEAERDGQLCFLCSVLASPHRIVWPTFRVDPSTSINPTQKLPLRQPKRFVSMVILNTTKLTRQISSHTICDVRNGCSHWGMDCQRNLGVSYSPVSPVWAPWPNFCQQYLAKLVMCFFWASTNRSSSAGLRGLCLTLKAVGIRRQIIQSLNKAK